MEGTGKSKRSLKPPGWLPEALLSISLPFSACLPPPLGSPSAPLELGGRRLGAGSFGFWALRLRPGAGFTSGTLSLPESPPPPPLLLRGGQVHAARRFVRRVEGGLAPGTLG